jgi:hypothetical protein
LTARTLSALGISLLALAMSLGGYAYVTDLDDLAPIGILVSVPAATALVVGTLRTQATVTDDQLAAAHAAGYALALDHVARGLLDQHTAPTGGGRNDGQLAEVRALPAPRRVDERAAG